ncbi:MAG: hypothetical protein ACW990_07705 [Promethearchaeota archaeon]|jgi:hypothetical protein
MTGEEKGTQTKSIDNSNNIDWLNKWYDYQIRVQRDLMKIYDTRASILLGANGFLLAILALPTTLEVIDIWVFIPIIFIIISAGLNVLTLYPKHIHIRRQTDHTSEEILYHKNTINALLSYFKNNRTNLKIIILHEKSYDLETYNELREIKKYKIKYSVYCMTAALVFAPTLYIFLSQV